MNPADEPIVGAMVFWLCDSTGAVGGANGAARLHWLSERGAVVEQQDIGRPDRKMFRIPGPDTRKDPVYVAETWDLALATARREPGARDVWVSPAGGIDDVALPTVRPIVFALEADVPVGAGEIAARYPRRAVNFAPHGGPEIEPWLPPLWHFESQSNLSTADEGSVANAAIARDFFENGIANTVTFNESDVATGKSRAMIEAFAQHAAKDPDARLLVVVESHKIGMETEHKFSRLFDQEYAGHGLSVERYIGSDRPNPRADEIRAALGDDIDTEITPDFMCLRVKAREVAGAEFFDGNQACGGCPFLPSNPAVQEGVRPGCPYKMQEVGEARKRLAEAQVVIVAGDRAHKRGVARAVARSETWTPVERDADGNPLRDYRGEWMRKSGPAIQPRGRGVVSGRDFTHAWVDEINVVATSLDTKRTIDTAMLLELKQLAANVLRVRADVEDRLDSDAADRAAAGPDAVVAAYVEAMEEREKSRLEKAEWLRDMTGRITGPLTDRAKARKARLIEEAGDTPVETQDDGLFKFGEVITHDRLIDSVAGMLAKTKAVIEEQAAKLTSAAEGGVSVRNFAESGITTARLDLAVKMIWKMTMKPERALGGMSSSEIREMARSDIEDEGATSAGRAKHGVNISQHIRIVRSIAQFVGALRDVMPAVEKVEKARDRAVYDIARKETFGQLRGSHLEQYIEMERDALVADANQEIRTAVTRDDPMPGIGISIARKKEGAAYVKVDVERRSEVSRLLKELPLMITAAAMDHDLVLAALDGRDVAFKGVPVVRDGPGAIRFQIMDDLMPKARLSPQTGNPDRAMAARRNTMRSTMSAIALGRLGTQISKMERAKIGDVGEDGYPLPEIGPGGLICFKSQEEYIRDTLNGNDVDEVLLLNHHMNITGSNDWETSPSLQIDGRIVTDVRALELQAEALFFKNVGRIPVDAKTGRAQFVRQTIERPVRHGSTEMALIDVERHTDPFVELLRANLTGENLRQGDGRARAARRELWNSVLILINTSAEIDRTVARLTTTQKRDALAGFIAPALHLGALPIGGHGNRQGFQFQAIARAALARMGNPTGAMPDGADNPALLVQAGEEVSPTLCKDRLRGVLHGELWRLLNEIIQVFENGEQFELYEVGGWLPFARFGWHRVEVKVNGHAYAGFAIGTTADDATSRYRRVLSDGFAVMTDPANAVNDARDGEFVPLTPTSVSIEPDKRLEKLRAAWVDRGVIPLTGGALHDVLPELFGSRETAKRALADMRQSMVDQAIAGQVAMGGSAVELSGQKRAGENDKGPEVELENPYKEIAPILTYFADGLSFSPDSESDVVTQSMVDLQGFDAEFASFVGLSSNVAGGAPAALVGFKTSANLGGGLPPP
ncbi:MAG: hypothetical protein R3D59_06110 [Paracoccaceae bacterium]